MVSSSDDHTGTAVRAVRGEQERLAFARSLVIVFSSLPSRVMTPILLALASACALSALWVATYEVEATSRADRGVQFGFTELADTRAGEVAKWFAHSVDPVPFAVMGAVLVGIALIRRRPRLALAAGVILAGANVTTQVIKLMTVDTRAYDVAAWQGGMGQELWPSGHTTGVMTLVLCLVLVSPHRLRPLAAAVGALFVVAVVYSILLLAWHLPSDVLGGFLVSAAWTLATVAVLHAAEHRWPSSERRGRPLQPAAVLRPAVRVAILGLAGVAGIALSRPHSVVAQAIEHSAFALGAPLIAATALALSTGVALALRR